MWRGMHDSSTQKTDLLATAVLSVYLVTSSASSSAFIIVIERLMAFQQRLLVQSVIDHARHQKE